MTYKENPAKFVLDAHQRIKEKKYWLEQLSGEVVKSFFPYDRKEPDTKPSYRSTTFEFSGDTFEKLMQLSNNSDIRLHIILLAVLTGLLYKYTTNNDIIVGSPIQKQEIKGEFINTVLILRNQVQGNLSYKNMLLNLSQTMAEANENVNYPISTLFYQLNIPYRENEFPLFDVALLLKNIHDKKDIQHLKLNMIFSFMRKEDRIAGEVEYHSTVYRQSTIEQIVSHYRKFLTEVIANINIALDAVDILGVEEKKQLLFDLIR
jgi:non-ribosomal peptide synthetase component F